MSEISEEIRYVMSFTTKKAKTQHKHAEKFVKFTVL